MHDESHTLQVVYRYFLVLVRLLARVRIAIDLDQQKHFLAVQKLGNSVVPTVQRQKHFLAVQNLVSSVVPAVQRM